MEKVIIEARLEEVKPNPFQPQTRLEVDEATAEKFGLSIMVHGLLQLPVARRDPAGGIEIGDGWRRVAGFKWLREHGHAGYDVIPIEVREFDDQQMADLVIEANTTRDDLNPIDLAWFYARYLEKFPKVTQSELARRHNKSQPEIANTVRLLELPEAVQRLIIARKITGTHGLRLLSLGDRDLMRRLAEETVDNELSVAALDARVKQVYRQQHPLMADMAPKSEEKTAALAATMTVTTSAGAATPAPEPVRPAEKSKVEKQTEEPSEKPKPAAPAAAPAATPAVVKTNWRCKMVLDEKKDHVLASCMKAGGMPVFTKLTGNFIEALEQMPAWVAELEDKWEKEGK